MEEKKKNPPLEVDDRVVMIYMDDPYPVPVGTKGTVIEVGHDPIVKGEMIYNVKWDNDRTLAIVSETDMWLKEDQLKKQDDNEIMEAKKTSGQNFVDTLMNVKDVFQLMDKDIVFDFFETIREIGIVNMFESSAFAYSGPEYLKQFIRLREMEGYEYDEDKLEKLYELSVKSQTELVQAALKILENENSEFDLNRVNDKIRRLASKALSYFILIKSHK